MGWHVGLTYEEMKERFGSDGGGTGPTEQPGPSGRCENGASEGPTEAASLSSPSSAATATTNKTTTTTNPEGEQPKQPRPATPTACPLPQSPDSHTRPPPPPGDHERIYHLCRKADWEECVASRIPYFPRTFLGVGKFTRASLYLEDIVDVANEYYYDDPREQEEDEDDEEESTPKEQQRQQQEKHDDWIVLEINAGFLYELGIPVLAATAPESSSVQCLQVFGGLSTHPAVRGTLVTSVYPMKRRDVDGKFIGMMQSILSERGVDEEHEEHEVSKQKNGDDCECPPVLKDTLTPKTTTEDEDDDENVNNAETDKVAEPTPQAESDTKPKKKGFFSKLTGKKKSASPKE
mmetsp:Transcript_7030/g.14346  ORF Transcript_7030/g.14346 Transcript_7030/m.14346 type:complete len:349 (-) Transcript_7030:2390-3436(-)|eukprot:CAMPEP_0201215222 /NCGR_PEP_ID=MMETSP0851-20130426/188827_1 /ASSEMBLY_ACC=CAM_ASM_000631 /TAXON_ID=183588 /ORGANISM="Pseudo-nitzschia fraudulenta, Strain WWA7" /LENGTH=348 /DNA_ID=CAMNT_0047504663 /DNA_START=196 /DNA_END=1242 /DNA_ORIENTATION=-